MKFFIDGTTVEYTGGRSEDQILSWLKKKTGPAAEELKTTEDLNKFKQVANVVVIGAFKVVFFSLLYCIIFTNNMFV